MKLQYFRDTDTLYIEFRRDQIVETRDLDPDTTADVDAEGRVCALTFEQASRRTDVKHLSVEGMTA